MIEGLIRSALHMQWEEKENGVKREVGFHASDAGYCIKKVILGSQYPEFKKPITPVTENTFHVGHMMHDDMDNALRLLARETAELLWIQPWRLKSFNGLLSKIYIDGDILSTEGRLDPVVYGTPDNVMVHVPTKSIIICDFKTANKYSQGYRARGDRSRTNELQLGTYLPPIMEMFENLGIDLPLAEASVVYIRKDDLNLVVHEFDAKLCTIAARDYWTDVGKEYVKFVKSGMIVFPEPDAPEKWHCNYCNMFDNLSDCSETPDIGVLQNLHGGE